MFERPAREQFPRRMRRKLEHSIRAFRTHGNERRVLLGHRKCNHAVDGEDGPTKLEGNHNGRFNGYSTNRRGHFQLAARKICQELRMELFSAFRWVCECNCHDIFGDCVV